MPEPDKHGAPSLCRGNPGIGIEAQLAVSGPHGQRVDDVNVVRLLASVLQEQGYPITNEETYLSHPESGYAILPQLVGVQLLDNGGVQSVTTVQVNHSALAPAGVFEYQHSTGSTLAEAVSKGFEQWAQTDLVPLVDATRPRPKDCTFMELELPAQESRPKRARRIILGPVGHLMQNRSAVKESEEHPFCPCCLLTRSWESFREWIEGDDFICLRLFAMRDPQGIAGADCRVNGEDWERGTEALREYVLTWPEAGFEFRKQYVVIRNAELAEGISARENEERPG